MRTIEFKLQFLKKKRARICFRCASFLFCKHMVMARCPICSAKIEKSLRYPNYVCFDCCKRACDENGRPLKFHNIDLSGGFLAFYVDTNEKYESHICYIDGVKCYADEAHFGGIVIEVDKRTFRKWLIQKIGRGFEKIDKHFQEK
jgi:hypothetical protein